jgi:NDP-mannose synthase
MSFKDLPALVMAGGAGTRMGASGITIPKPLVPVLGLPLLERNLMQLARFGFRKLYVAVPGSRPSIEEYLHTRGRSLIEAIGGSLEVIVEHDPLGTIGATRLVDTETLLVVNADNLTSLSLADLVSSHQSSGAAMTTAVHAEPFRIPFAQVESHEGWVTGYREKPTFFVDVASAAYVLDARATRLIGDGESIGAPTLIDRLLANGEKVLAWQHKAPWIDVNNAAAIATAESLLSEQTDDFECWGEPDVEVVGALLFQEDKMLLEYRPEGAKCYPGIWDTPGGKLEKGENPEEALVRELREELGIKVSNMQKVACFDDIDLHSSRVFRHHVYAVPCVQQPKAVEGQRLDWVERSPTPEIYSLPVRRSLAWLNHMESLNA